VWVDALCRKIRVDERAVNSAVMVVTGTKPAGTREILAVGPESSGSEATHTVRFKQPKARGLKKVRLIV
jgi:transposase-like protein